jgi:hypothetical protein
MVAFVDRPDAELTRMRRGIPGIGDLGLAPATGMPLSATASKFGPFLLAFRKPKPRPDLCLRSQTGESACARKITETRAPGLPPPGN